jgi:peroxiredoxin (alkyl hydroperoxide reductase subunit C)
VTSLLAELDPRLDAEYHADSLLAVLAADQYRHLRREREMPIERVRAGWESVVAAVEALAGVTGRGDDLYSLPADLPVPEDDGAADGLRGSRPAGVALPATDGSEVVLAELPGRTVVFAYPRTGTPGEESPGGNEAWDAIPGARGCTPQACAIRDEHARFEALGVRVFGLSTQTTEDQREAVERLHLPYPLLSDERNELRLPTFEAGGLTLHRRLTLILTDGVVEDLVYPVFPPDRAAEQALARL